MGRSPCCNVDGVRKGAWTKDEDNKLCDYIAKHGEGAWRSLPQKAGLLRCGKSCRLRWANYLKPGIKRGEFSPKEEQIIIRLHASLGSKWSTIAKHLPGRTDNEIKNQWNTKLTRVVAQMEKENDQKKLVENSDKRVPEFGESLKSPIPTSSKLLNEVASKFSLSPSIASLVTGQIGKSVSTQSSNKQMCSPIIGTDNSEGLMSTTSGSNNNICASRSPESEFDAQVSRPVCRSSGLLNKMATIMGLKNRPNSSGQIPSVFNEGNFLGTYGGQFMDHKDEAWFVGQISKTIPNSAGETELTSGSNGLGSDDGYCILSMEEMVSELMDSNSWDDDTYFGDFIDATLLNPQL